jgi:hypothetical protein
MTIKRNLKIPSILALALAGLLVLAGCGGGSDDGSGDEQAVKTAMYEWAAVDTPAAACERMSSGFLFFVGDGDPDNCEKRIVKVMGKLKAAKDVEINSVDFEDGQANVNATADGSQQVYWFIKQDGKWLLNSIGLRQGEGPDPDNPPPANGESQAPPQ